jgi:hypothetical protein
MAVEGVESDLPIAFAATILLRLGRVLAWMTRLGEVARKVRLGFGSAISDASMVTVSELVGASHCG